MLSLIKDTPDVLEMRPGSALQRPAKLSNRTYRDLLRLLLTRNPAPITMKLANRTQA